MVNSCIRTVHLDQPFDIKIWNFNSYADSESIAADPYIIFIYITILIFYAA